MLKLLVALCILILPVLHLNISVEAASPHNIETVFDYALDIDFYEDAEFPGVRFPNLAGLTGRVPGTGWYAFWNSSDAFSTVTVPGYTWFSITTGIVTNGRIQISTQTNPRMTVWVPARHFGL